MEHMKDVPQKYIFADRDDEMLYRIFDTRRLDRPTYSSRKLAFYQIQRRQCGCHDIMKI